jgi:hypothetical protein
MARHLPSADRGGVIDILPHGGLVIKKKVHKNLDGGKLGLTQIRKPKNIVSNPRLLKILECMASNLAGTTPGTLGKAQENFAKVRKDKCKL